MTEPQSEPEVQPAQQRGFRPALVGVSIGLGANILPYLIGWWFGKHPPKSWHLQEGWEGIDAFARVLCWGTATIVIGSLVAGRMLSRKGRRTTARALVTSTILSIVLLPASVALTSYLHERVTRG